MSWDTVSPGYRPLSWGYAGVLRMPPVSQDANSRFQTAVESRVRRQQDSRPLQRKLFCLFASVLWGFSFLGVYGVYKYIERARGRSQNQKLTDHEVLRLRT